MRYFRKIREGGRPVPLFVPLLQKTEATSKVVFFMHEIAYWGTDQEVKYLFSILILPIFFGRNAAFACMGIRRFDEAEEVMLGLFYKQTEILRRSILNCFVGHRFGISVYIFSPTYMKTPCLITPNVRPCVDLWLYNDEGVIFFSDLKSRQVVRTRYCSSM